MRGITLAAILAVTPTLRAADTLDVAEAKKRGVAVEVVELEHEKSRTANLSEQVATLTQEVTKLKKQLVDAQKAITATQSASVAFPMAASM